MSSLPCFFFCFCCFKRCVEIFVFLLSLSLSIFFFMLWKWPTLLDFEMKFKFFSLSLSFPLLKSLCCYIVLQLKRNGLKKTSLSFTFLKFVDLILKLFFSHTDWSVFGLVFFSSFFSVSFSESKTFSKVMNDFEKKNKKTTNCRQRSAGPGAEF